MQRVTYTPAEVLHCSGAGARQARASAKKKGQSVLQDGDLAKGLRSVAGAAADLGKLALTDLVQRQAEVTSVEFFDDAFEVVGFTNRKRIAYTEVQQIRAMGQDRFEVVYRSGSVVLKPVAHLVAGRLKVPVGWVRNGMEVPYSTLLDELTGRCGVEVSQE